MKKILMLMVLVLTMAVMAMGCSKGTMKGDKGMGADGSTMTGTETVTEDQQKMGMMGKEDITGKYIEDAATSAKFSDIYFDFDMYSIKDDAKPALKEMSSYLANNNAKVIIEGHCDERGTTEYNLALGDRRANATKQYLVASGVSASKIETISYGEEKPQCEESTEDCWAKNRRAHFVVLLPK